MSQIHLSAFTNQMKLLKHDYSNITQLQFCFEAAHSVFTYPCPNNVTLKCASSQVRVGFLLKLLPYNFEPSFLQELPIYKFCSWATPYLWLYTSNLNKTVCNSFNNYNKCIDMESFSVKGSNLTQLRSQRSCLSFIYSNLN